MWRYYLYLLAVIGLIIILIIILIPGKSKTVTQQTFLDYRNTDANISLTIDGPEVADQNHQGLGITVNSSEVTYYSYTGYNNTVTNYKSFPNNLNAYNVFVTALYRAGFNRGNTNPKASNYSGFCPLGDRYIYNLSENGSTITQFWSTSCGGSSTYAGNVALTLNLFQAQVPDYTDLSQNVSL